MYCDANDDGNPVVQFNFSNGWTLSLCQRWSNRVMNASAMRWPSSKPDQWENLGNELSDDEIAQHMAHTKMLKDAAP